jgi:hypothetical protein
MVEIIVTHKDGRQMCWTLAKGEVYEVRGDETAIEFVVL